MPLVKNSEFRVAITYIIFKYTILRSKQCGINGCITRYNILNLTLNLGGGDKKKQEKKNCCLSKNVPGAISIEQTTIQHPRDEIFVIFWRQDKVMFSRAERVGLRALNAWREQATQDVKLIIQCKQAISAVVRPIVC